MYTKIHKPSTSGKSVYDNKSSAGRIVNYFRSEELKENPNAHIHYQTDKGQMNYGEAIQNIDNHSKDIESGKVKFSSITFNLSQEEAQALAQGKEGDNRTKKERVEDLTKKLMNEYAKSFGSKDKNLKEGDMVYVAKVHEHRKKNGVLNKENQTHVHVVVSNLTKDKKHYINPETKHRKHFNKVEFQTAAQITASKELGTEIPVRKTMKTEVKKSKTDNLNAIKDAVKGQYYSPDGKLENNENVVNKLNTNKKGLDKNANKVTVVELTPRKGNYFNNPENARKSANKIIENYAQSLKKEGTKKEDLVYYYKINTNEAKKEGVGKKATEEGKEKNNEKSPSLEIIISNRNKEMTKSVGANQKTFDFDKFNKLNNQFNNQIEKERNHISPTEKNVNRLNKQFKAGIDYKETYQNRWLGKETKEYKETKDMLSDKFNGPRKGYAKGDKPIIDKIEQGTKQAVSQGGSIAKRMFAAISQNEDMEILQAIEKRKSQELGRKRER